MADWLALCGPPPPFPPSHLGPRPICGRQSQLPWRRIDGGHLQIELYASSASGTPCRPDGPGPSIRRLRHICRGDARTANKSGVERGGSRSGGPRRTTPVPRPAASLRSPARQSLTKASLAWRSDTLLFRCQTAVAIRQQDVCLSQDQDAASLKTAWIFIYHLHSNT